MRYYVITGEASGDLHASNLIRELKILDNDADFRCWGGDLMKKQGVKLVKHYRDLAFMGFAEVLMNIRTIVRNIKFCKKDIKKYKPDVMILVDYPGFNLRIAKFAHNIAIKVFYYISPQVWAWKQSRVKKIKKYVDKMFVVLPFEKQFYANYDFNVDFVGHPLLDVIENDTDFNTDKNSFFKDNGLLDKPIIALIPGSRKQEISKMLPQMLSVIPDYNKYQFVIGGVSSISEDFYKKIYNNFDIKIVFNKTYELLKSSEAALVTSGTATLEAALLDVPEVVCYKSSYISYFLAKQFVGSKIKFISLVNLIMDKEIVKELIQRDFNKKNLKTELNKILINKEIRSSLFDDYKKLKKKLGGRGASHNTAQLIIKYLKE